MPRKSTQISCHRALKYFSFQQMQIWGKQVGLSEKKMETMSAKQLCAAIKRKNPELFIKTWRTYFIYMAGKGTSFVVSLPQKLAAGIVRGLAFTSAMNILMPLASQRFADTHGFGHIMQNAVVPDNAVKLLLRSSGLFENEKLIEAINHSMQWFNTLTKDLNSLTLNSDLVYAYTSIPISQFKYYGSQPFEGATFIQNIGDLKHYIYLQSPGILYFAYFLFCMMLATIIIDLAFYKSGTDHAASVARKMGIKNPRKKVEKVLQNANKPLSAASGQILLEPKQAAALKKSITYAKRTLANPDMSDILKAKRRKTSRQLMKQKKRQQRKKVVPK
jgi:hypothetical protein